MANTPNLNPSPKVRFIQSEASVKAHHALLERDDLARSLDAALLHYQLLLVFEAKDANAAAAAHYKMAGALEFIHQFKYLAEVAVPKKADAPAQLDYRAQ